MRFLKITTIMVVLTVLFSSPASARKYVTVDGDPMGTRIYTLDNGLKIYLSVNKETPRIQTYIAVRVGGKNDPADNTGLAHYLEHIMFKGTEKLGTQNYAAEKPLLDQIQALYDVYRTKTDPAEREKIYAQIDSVSYLASKIAIANEYDKAMSIIGAKGTNAFTSNDVTCYTEDIPSNQVDTWAKVQADRFKNMVVRGFHTELEAVYEEYNRGLTSDFSKSLLAIDSVLFANHPYGTQDVIGTQQHLKNPDITAILKQKATWYVPNNTAICASGDLDPDEFVSIIEKYFGDWKATDSVPNLEIKEEAPITSPVRKDVLGQDAEFVFMAWRYPGEKFSESEISPLVSSILYNGMAGLMDLDLNNKQKLLASASENYGRSDHGELILYGFPQEGQTLDQVRDLLLGEVAKLRSGDFDEKLLSSAIANFKLEEMRALEDNGQRAMKYVDSFVNCHEWQNDVFLMNRLEKVTKADVVAWANKYLGENNYVYVYKHHGEDPNIHKIEAPKITPIETNRDKQSAFLKEIQDTEVEPIEPVFVDYSKDLTKTSWNGLEMLYKKNENNGIANLIIYFDRGTMDDPSYSQAVTYLDYLGTPTMSADERAQELYALACDYSIRPSLNSTSISVSGLDENVGKALDIVLDLIKNAQPDEAVLASMKNDLIKERADNKLAQRSCVSALRSYITYGPEFVKKVTLDNNALNALKSEDLLGSLRDLLTYDHKVLYYGPSSDAAVKSLLSNHHKVSGSLKPVVKQHPQKLETPESKVYLVDYDSRQFNYIQYSDRGETYQPEDDANVELFNEYFGGGMNSIVFQEMRESKALAYSAGASFVSPSYKTDSYSFMAMIGSQNDKLAKAVKGFDSIINDMPRESKNLEIAKKAIDSRLRTQRSVGASVLFNYLRDQELGVNEPRAKYVFSKVGSLTMDDLVSTQEKWIKGRTYVYGIVGDTRDLDKSFLNTLGPVKVLTLEEIFGY